MDKDNLINDINKLIELSRYFLYDSKYKAKNYIKDLQKAKKHLEEGKIHKVIKEGSDELNDS